jgi:uncharacterized LabA/DUF88 family protein
MTVLIAVDGHSLNLGLQKVAQTRNKNSRESKNKSVRFYTDSAKVDEESRLMGRVVKYFGPKGYGFISATDGNSYFFHNNEITNKHALCNANEDRYPHPTSREFQNRILKKVVTLDPAVNEDGRSKAEEVRLEFGAQSLDRFYRLRREPFLEMLADSGYEIVRCRPSYNTGKAKSIDCRIYLDALSELDEDDTLIILTDDPIFCDLVDKLRSFDVHVTVVTFDTPSSEELRNTTKNSGGQVLLLNDYLDDLELGYEDEDEDAEEISAEEEALAST